MLDQILSSQHAQYILELIKIISQVINLTQCNHLSPLSEMRDHEVQFWQDIITLFKIITRNKFISIATMRKMIENQNNLESAIAKLIRCSDQGKLIEKAEYPAKMFLDKKRIIENIQLSMQMAKYSYDSLQSHYVFISDFNSASYARRCLGLIRIIEHITECINNDRVIIINDNLRTRCLYFTDPHASA